MIRGNSSRCRNWCFTLNNYEQQDRDKLEQFFNEGGARYVIYQPERGVTGDTPHLQGYIIFSNARTLNGVRSIFGNRAHWEVAYSSAEANIAYCSKESTRDSGAGFGVVEHGTRSSIRGTGSGRGHRTDLDIIAERVRDGATLRELAEDHPKEIILHSRGINTLQALCVKPRTSPPSVYWFYGPTGSGKSRFANEESPDAYWKDPCSPWWDGYDGTADVIIDDYRRDFCTFASLLRLFDRYPLQLQVKGGYVNIRAQRIYITTPKSPEETWENRTSEDIAQLSRRITLVRYFGYEAPISSVASTFSHPPEVVPD